MAPGLKPKKMPLSWASTVKSSGNLLGGLANPAAGSSGTVDDAENAAAKVTSAKAASKGTSKILKKLPPAPDAATEVYSEFQAAKQKKVPLQASSGKGGSRSPEFQLSLPQEVHFPRSTQKVSCANSCPCACTLVSV